jgi:RHS repeat-associated protein
MPAFVLPTEDKPMAYKYKYNGKEWQDELGLNMYDMDMRDYDPAIGRWVAQDPVVHFEYSPYSAFDNNPVFWADPSGADSQTNEPYEIVASTVVNNSGVVIDYRPDGDPRIYLNSRIGPVIGFEEIGRVYKKGEKIFNVNNSNPDYSLYSLISSTGYLLSSAAVPSIPKSIPVFNDSGKLIGYWNTRLNVPFRALKMVAGVLKPLSSGLSALSIANDIDQFRNNEISGQRFTYRMSGTAGSIIATSMVGGLPGFAVGVIVAGVFYTGEMIYDSSNDTRDLDNNPNTVHSLGEFKKNSWMLFNLKNWTNMLRR